MGANGTPEWFFQIVGRPTGGVDRRGRGQDVWFGELFSGAWRVYTRQARGWIPASAVLYVVPALIAGLASLADASWARGIVYAILVATTSLLTATCARQLAEGDPLEQTIELGPRSAGLLVRVRGLALIAVVAGIGVAVGVGFLLRVVPAIVLIAYLGLAAPAIALEAGGAAAAFRRSASLPAKNVLGMLGTSAVIALLAAGSFAIVSFLTAPLHDVVAAVIAPLVVGAVVAPYVAVALTLVYFTRTEEVKLTLAPLARRFRRRRWSGTSTQPTNAQPNRESLVTIDSVVELIANSPTTLAEDESDHRPRVATRRDLRTRYTFTP